MNDTEENKKLLLQSLTQSFVDDYLVYKNMVERINNDFDTLELDYQWTYDEFCVNFLNESMKKLEEINIFKFLNFEDFSKNFWKFNLIVIRTIIINKFDELGYNYDEFESLHQNSKFLDKPHIKN